MVWWARNTSGRIDWLVGSGWMMCKRLGVFVWWSKRKVGCDDEVWERVAVS